MAGVRDLGRVSGSLCEALAWLGRWWRGQG